MDAIIRCKELKKDDYFLFLGIPYKVVKISNKLIYYGPFDRSTGRVFNYNSTFGINSMMRVTRINNLFTE